MRRAALALVLLVCSCSLPLSTEVRSAGGVTAGQDSSDGVLVVIPPGPAEGESPQEIVQGFLQAQTSAEDTHAAARSYLTPEAARGWDDRDEVLVYDLASQQITVLEAPTAQTAQVEVRFSITGRLGADGAFTPRAGRVGERYGLVRTGGQWRLDSVPSGLRLTAADFSRTFVPVDTYYPVDAVRGPSTRLTPDRVFVPAGPGLADRLVRRVLAPPSAGLTGSVEASPMPGVRSVELDGTGIVTVDLDVGADDLTPAAELLSAQLVWTLRGLGSAFTGLRLAAQGRPYTVRGQNTVQDDQSWAQYDPEALGLTPPYLYVDRRRLRAAPTLTLPSTVITAGQVGEGQAVPVDEVAMTADRTQVALLERGTGGRASLRLGALRGPYPVVLRDRALGSPSFGSGDRGLWLLEGGRRVVVLPPGGDTLRPVTLTPPAPGVLSRLRVSRDGSRVGLVSGGRVYVGHVTGPERAPTITGLLALPVTGSVVDLAWATGTELLLVVENDRSRQLVRAAVDGSRQDVVPTAGLAPERVAAWSGATVFEAAGVLYDVTGRVPARLSVGRQPAFPG